MALAKTPTESKNWLPLLLAATAVLGGLVLWDRQSDDSAQKGGGGIAAPVVAKGAGRLPPQEQAATRADQSINPLANLGLDKLHDTTRRPLFEKSRRPIEAPAQLPLPKAEPPAPVAARAVDQNALSLLGIVASEGRTIALLKRNQTGQNIRVEVGEEVDGWTIVRIEPQRVFLRQGDTQIALQLFRKKPSK
jgi:hypothetical protein